MGSGHAPVSYGGILPFLLERMRKIPENGEGVAVSDFQIFRFSDFHSLHYLVVEILKRNRSSGIQIHGVFLFSHFTIAHLRFFMEPSTPALRGFTYSRIFTLPVFRLPL